MSFKPTPFDIEWTRHMIANFRTETAIWGVPFNHSIYRFNKTAKTVELIHGPEEGPRGNLLEQMKAICADPSIGYTVTKNIQPVSEEVMAQAFPEEATGTGKAHTKIALGADLKENKFKKLMAKFAQKPMAAPTKYRCNACLQTFKTKIAHNCSGGHWSAEKDWTEIYE